MNRHSVTDLSDDQLLEEFVAYAHDWGEFCEAGAIPKVNRLVKKLAALVEEFKCRGPAVRLRLAPFLDSMDPGVRYYVAIELLALLPERSRAAIASVGEAAFSGISFTARMTLSFLDDGTFNPT